jgi:hypothetical protein
VNFFNTMPFGGHADPTEAQLSWQIFTSLTMGAKGILYFCYWSPAGQGGFSRGGGVMYPMGTASSKYFNKTSGKVVGDLSLSSGQLYRRGAHYRHAKRLNSIVRNWGRWLLTANSTAVFHLRPAAAVLKNSTCYMGPGFQPLRVLTADALLKNVTDLAVSSRCVCTIRLKHTRMNCMRSIAVLSRILYRLSTKLDVVLFPPWIFSHDSHD